MEVTNILGWVIDTHHMDAKIPRKKVRLWMGILQDIKWNNSCTLNQLKVMIGRMVQESMTLLGAQTYIVHFWRILHTYLKEVVHFYMLGLTTSVYGHD